MKNQLTLWLCLAIALPSFAQNSYPVETVGSPSSSLDISSYSGWSNNGVLNYSGTAQIQNTNCSDNIGASGGGNIYFTNTVGTSFKITGFNLSVPFASADFTFSLHGYDANNLSELVLEYTTDGANYTPITYKRLFRNFMAPTPWDIMVSDPLPSSANSPSLALRLRQTTTTKTFRVDDMQMNFYYSLPIKLISFSATNTKGEIALNWRATATDIKESFIVEKSVDGRNFAPISNAKQASVGDHSYNFIDKNFTSKAFYRLKLIDAEGKRNYSQTLFIDKASAQNNFIQKLYPIPATDVVNAQLFSKSSQNALVTLVNAGGTTVVNRTFALSNGINNCSINVQSLAVGTYYLKITTAESTETKIISIK